MDASIEVYCPTCFALPGEHCMTKYVVHPDGVTPVLCATHSTRVVDSQRNDFFKNLSPKSPSE